MTQFSVVTSSVTPSTGQDVKIFAQVLFPLLIPIIKLVQGSVPGTMKQLLIPIIKLVQGSVPGTMTQLLIPIIKLVQGSVPGTMTQLLMLNNNIVLIAQCSL